MIRLEICKVEAYERKASAGGKFSAVVVVRSLDVNGIEGDVVERKQGGVFETQLEAFQWAREVCNERAGHRRLSIAHYSSNRFRKDYTIWSK